MDIYRNNRMIYFKMKKNSMQNLRRMRENRLLLQYQYFLGDLFLMGFECLFFNKYSTSVEISFRLLHS